VSLGDRSHKELRLSIAQDDLDAFTKRVAGLVRIDFPGLPLWQTRIQKVVPRATLAPPHPALAAVNGGPLPVKLAKRRSDELTPESYEFLAPRFTAIVRLSRSESDQLYSGQTGRVLCRSCNESIGEHLYRTISRWIATRQGDCR
jgi:putative peptide zinc metalloprotease protein